MSNTIIKLENISKQYRLGTVGTQTLRGDFQRWWHRMAGKEDPTLKIGQTNQLDQVLKENRKSLFVNHKSSFSNQDSEYVWALKDINLEVKQGEVLGIIGKNGAGKSTLLKLLSRVTGPTTGQIKVKGRIASLLEVGTGFHPELTGRENIFLNGAILGMTKNDIRQKFDEIVDFAGVAKYIDTPVKRYSSGMYVRLAFAVAAHLEPDILVVDEVLAVGDAEFQKKAIGKMQDVSTQGGRTVLFVSHNMDSVKKLCKRGVVLSNGKIEFNGNIKEAVRSYLPMPLKLTHSGSLKVEDNYGSGEIKVKEIFIKDLNNNLLTKVKTGQTFKFVIAYEVLNKDADYLKNINVSISLQNQNNERLFNHHNKLIGKAYTLNDFLNSKELEFLIYDLPIVPGHYYLSYNIYQRYDLIDKIGSDFLLEVEKGSFFNNLVDNRAEDNETLVNAKWNFV